MSEMTDTVDMWGFDDDDPRVIARETVELTIEIREGDIYEYWAMTDEYPHFHGSATGIEAIRRALNSDPRFGHDSRKLLTLTDTSSTDTEQEGDE